VFVALAGKGENKHCRHCVTVLCCEWDFVGWCAEQIFELRAFEGALNYAYSVQLAELPYILVTVRTDIVTVRI